MKAKDLVCRSIHEYIDESCPYLELRLPELTICVTPGIYPPKLDSFLLARELVNIVNEGDKVLDIGTGSGILAILASMKGAHTTATEIHEDSANYIKYNALLNGVEVSVRIGDMFRPVSEDERFDIIVSNPPSLPTPLNEDSDKYISRAIDGGDDGRRYLNPLIAQAPRYMQSGSCFLTVHSNLANIKKTKEDLENKGFHVTIVEDEFPIGQISRQRIQYFLDTLPPNCHPLKRGKRWYQSIAVFKAQKL